MSTQKYRHFRPVGMPELERGRHIQVNITNLNDPRANWLRSPRIAMTCIHLDPHKLSNTEAKGMEETARKLQTSCVACTGETSLQKCKGGGGHDGYTTLSYCVNKCTIFQGPSS